MARARDYMLSMRLIPGLTPLLVCLALTPHRAAAATELAYTLYALGLPIADATLGADLSAQSYRISLTYRTVGLAELAIGGRLEQQAHGVFSGQAVLPKLFSSKARARGRDRVVSLSYRDETPSIAAIHPPPETEREEVPAPLRVRTMDPLSKIAALLRRVAATGRCDGDARDYDGRRLEVFQARTMGEETLPGSARSSFAGPALRCEFVSQILAGFRLGRDRNEDARPHGGIVWLAPVGTDGQRWPVRLEIETRWFGHADIYLTGVTR